MEIDRSARKHGILDIAIFHALDNALTVIDLDPDADPPKVLAIGPDHAGNLLEITWLELADDVNLVIHAMPLPRSSTTCSHRPGRTCHERTEDPSHPQRPHPDRRGDRGPRHRGG